MHLWRNSNGWFSSVLLFWLHRLFTAAPHQRKHKSYRDASSWSPPQQVNMRFGKDSPPPLSQPEEHEHQSKLEQHDSCATAHDIPASPAPFLPSGHAKQWPVWIEKHDGSKRLWEGASQRSQSSCPIRYTKYSKVTPQSNSTGHFHCWCNLYLVTVVKPYLNFHSKARRVARTDTKCLAVQKQFWGEPKTLIMLLLPVSTSYHSCLRHSSFGLTINAFFRAKKDYFHCSFQMQTLTMPFPAWQLLNIAASSFPEFTIAVIIGLEFRCVRSGCALDRLKTAGI